MARFVPPSPTRRNALGIAAMASLNLLLPAAAARADTARTRPGASPLSAPGTPWRKGLRLRHGTVMQSFAFDEAHRCLYALQVVEGGVRLRGEKRPYTHDERARHGDLCLNRLDLHGTLTGHMYLKGFGHGGAMGVERHGAGSRLWTEWDAGPASGYGRGICRFRFADGHVLTRSSSRLTTYHPVPGSTSNSVTLDQGRRRLLLRYKLQGSPRFAVYDLARFGTRRARPLADFAQPDADLGLPFQGMALDGSTLYQLMGSGYGPFDPPEFGGTIYLGRTNWRTGTSHRVFPERTAPHLRPREPEGLGVRHSDGRLYFGLTQGTTGDRRFSLYAKTVR
ncbi:teichoic acid biosynthesis protein C [Streptomyces sp. NPDC102406]|uniref:phage baseplate protein n=1 Tax=Streptomyces sp. NPDC102406 TaxID=3366171 RepID=UPI0038213A2A